MQGPGSGLAALHHSVFPPHSSPSSSAAAAASFNAAMAAAAAAGQQFALITSQGIPFIQPGIPAIYSSPAGKYRRCGRKTETPFVMLKFICVLSFFNYHFV
jgi:hypothetical protein